MRLALFSDIHGNVHAFDACLDDLRAQGGADTIVGVGDYCMDGPHPREVLERLTALDAQCVRGNTDRYVSDVTAPADGEDEAELQWYRRELGTRWLAWLAERPFALRFGEGADALLVVHANPKTDDEHVWPDAEDDVLERFFDGVVERTIAFGHLHLPYARAWRDKVLVNVASAGLPKDGDPRAGYALVTRRSGGWEIKHRRVTYDIERVAADIEKSGMPGAAKRLRVLRRHRYKTIGERVP